MFSLVNSPVSPVDRKRLLTGGLSVGGQELADPNPAYRSSQPGLFDPVMPVEGAVRA
jgi:hypothetical protein